MKSVGAIIVLVFVFCSLHSCDKAGEGKPVLKDSSLQKKPVVPHGQTVSLDTAMYRRIWDDLVHGKPGNGWPVLEPYPLPRPVLPFRRVLAFYGNLYSAGMGVLGALPEEKMLAKLKQEVAAWQAADSIIPVQPALHYIAVTAQSRPGPDRKYRLRMPFGEIDKILALAKKSNALVFLDVQVGHSTLRDELPQLRDYLRLPRVHLGIDPEYSMKGGQVPARAIGTFDAADINYASEFLAKLVREHGIPPKMLIVHRFTQGMVTNYQKIQKTPEVQIVMHMDGFGSAAKKLNTYRQWIEKEPVQFTGFKLFYKQDGKLMKPDEVLKVHPKPVYIQYQ